MERQISAAHNSTFDGTKSSASCSSVGSELTAPAPAGSVLLTSHVEPETMRDDARTMGNSSLGPFSPLITRQDDRLSHPADAGPPASYSRVRVRGQGLGADELHRANEEVRSAIDALKFLFDEYPMLEIRAAATEAELYDALKLYRDMNHLSLTGVTCDQVVEHVLSHTVLLLYQPELLTPPICVTAATFSMRGSTMMLRLLATHPRMTRKGFGRIVVHFLKELCRALCKDEILVYTYPSSSPFYRALHFQHTHPHGESCAKLPVANSSAHGTDIQATREARRAFSAKENEMVCKVQPSMAQILARVVCNTGTVAVHPYACTRRRAGAAVEPSSVLHAQPSAVVSQSRRSVSCGISDFMKPGSHVITLGQQSIPCTDVDGPTDLSADPSSYRVSDEQLETWVAAVAPTFKCHAYRTSTPSDADVGVWSSGTVPEATMSAAAQAAKAILNNVVASRIAHGSHVAPISSRPRADDDHSEAQNPRKRSRLKLKEVYEVEKIVDVQRDVHNLADVKYLIKWKGWPAKYNTWEPVAHLKNLQAEIEAFESSRE